MPQITSILGVIAVWIALSVGTWWLHRLYARRRQRRKLALANEAWMRVREAPEIFADVRSAGFASGAADIAGRTNALLTRVNDYSDYFDDVSALRAELSRALGRDDCPPLTEILNMRRDIWAAADVLLIDDPQVFGEAFSEPGAYEEFCRDAEDLLFLDAAPLRDDPVALRLVLADEDMQTFVSGVEGEIADERERERFPTWREIIAYPAAWARAVPRGLAWLGGAGLTLAWGVGTLSGYAWQGLGVIARHVWRGGRAVGMALWLGLRALPGLAVKSARGLMALPAGLPRIRLRPVRPGAGFHGLRSAISRAPEYVRHAAARAAGLRHHPAIAQAAAFARRAGDRFPDRLSQGVKRAADMARDARDRAGEATARARERALGLEAGELGVHYDFLVKAHALRQRYADVLRRAPELSDTGRQFIARLELEKRSERLRLGTAKLRRRARLELVRFLSMLIAALERLRDRLADAPPQPAQATNLLTAPLHRMFLPPPSPREAGADYPGGLRAQARSWARGWGRGAQRMRDVTPEEDDADDVSPDAAPGGASKAAGPDAAEPKYDTAAPGRGPGKEQGAAEAASEKASSDAPTESAVRRVRRLFGIRDRVHRTAAETRRTQNGAAAGSSQPASAANGRADSGSAQTKRDDAQAEPADSPDTARSAEAQILPPLRGSRAGVYDESDATPGARVSLKSRLSTLGEGADEAPQTARDVGSTGNHQAHEGADASPGRSRWRRWFGR